MASGPPSETASVASGSRRRDEEQAGDAPKKLKLAIVPCAPDEAKRHIEAANTASKEFAERCRAIQQLESQIEAGQALPTTSAAAVS